MNPNYNSSDELNSTEQLEQQLKRLKPSPVGFDAEAILTSSGMQDQVALLDRSSKRRERSARWLAISSAFTCGAVVGALLACLVLIHVSASEPVTTNKLNQQAPQESIKIVQDAPRQDVNEIPHEDSQWSRSEWYFSAQLFENRIPHSTSRDPLMAGNFIRRSGAIDTRIDQPAIEEKKQMVSLPQSNQHNSKRKMPFRSIDREQLLDELFGDSRL